MAKDMLFRDYMSCLVRSCELSINSFKFVLAHMKPEGEEYKVLRDLALVCRYQTSALCRLYALSGNYPVSLSAYKARIASILKYDALSALRFEQNKLRSLNNQLFD